MKNFMRPRPNTKEEPMNTTWFKPTALCGLVAALAPAAASAQEGPVYTQVSWRGECPNGPKPTESLGAKSLVGAVFAAVAPKLVSGAVDAAATALSEAGKSKDFSSSARVEGKFYIVTLEAEQRLSPDIRCMVVERGRFSSSGTKDAAEPWFRFEAHVKVLGGMKFFQLEPVYAKVHRFEQKRWFDAGKRSYSVSITLATPGAASPFASAAFSFADLTEGEELRFGDWRLAQARSQPLAFPADMADVKRKVEAREKALAPYLLAMDILGPAKPEAPRPPPVLAQEPASGALDRFCKAVREHNAKVARQFALNDDRCAVDVEAARLALDRASTQVYRNKAAKGWAEKLCPNFVDPKTDEGKSQQSVLDACPGASPDSDNDKASAVVPLGFFATSATLVETRPGSRFAAYLGTALSAAKDDVSKAIVSRVVPDSTPADPAVEDAVARDGRRAIALAELAVTKAEDALAEAQSTEPRVQSKVTQAQIDLLKARIAANDAYRVVGLPVPYPSAD
jgi:hypothetical protein